MAGEVQEKSDSAQEEVPLTADRESNLRLKRLDLAHEHRMRIKIANEMLDRCKVLHKKMEVIDDELAGQRSFFE